MPDDRDEEPERSGGSTPPPSPPHRAHEHPSRDRESPGRSSAEGRSERPPPDPAREAPPDHERKRLFERAVPEVVKRVIERAVESGVEKLTELTERPESLRNFVSDLRLPKDVLSDVYAQIDDTKNGLYRVVAKEIRDVLEQTQIAEEIAKVLTKLSFEIKTEIRFVPNDRSAEAEEEAKVEGGAGIRPKVTSEVTVKDRAGADRRGR